MAELAIAAVKLVKKIHDAYNELEEQDNRADALFQRVTSLEPALDVFRKDMADPKKHTKPYERVLRRLNETLEDVEELLQQNKGGLNFIRRLFGGGGTSNEKEFNRLMTELSTAVADMNFAIQATKAANRDRNMDNQADKVVDKINKNREAIDKEGVEICVQCGESYKEKSNGKNHCRFHTARPHHSGGWACCQRKGATAKGCTSNTHRSTYHHDYIYSNYYRWMNQETNKNKDKWLKIDLDEHEEGYPDRWIEIGNRTDRAIYIYIGYDGWDRFYIPFTEAQLKKIPSKRKNGHPIINWEGTHEGDDSKTWSVAATWNISGGKVTGITASVKTMSADVALVKSISFSGVKEPGKITTISGEPARGLGARHQKGNYGLRVKKTGVSLPDAIFRDRMERQPQFETQVPAGWKFRVRPNVEIPKLETEVRAGKETFVHDLMLVNTGKSVIGILAAECELYVDGRWKRGKAVLRKPKEFSVDIEPRKTLNMEIALTFERPAGLGGMFYYRSWNARFGPIRYRLILEDLDGERCIHTFQYENDNANKVVGDRRSKNTRIHGGYVDDTKEYDRQEWQAEYQPKGSYNDPKVRIEFGNSSETYDEEALELLAYKARRDNKPEFVVKENKRDDSSSKLVAMYDPSVHQIYAFRIELTTQTGTLVDYLMYPLDYVVDVPFEKLNPHVVLPTEDSTEKHPPVKSPALPEVSGRRDSDPARAIRSSVGRKGGRKGSPSRSTGRTSTGRRRNRSRGRSAAAVKGPRRSRARSKSASRKAKEPENDFMSLSAPSESTGGAGASPKRDMLNSAPEGGKNVRASMANIIPGSAKGMRNRFESMNR